MNTGNKIIAESSYDEVWGTGLHIGNKEALNKTKWTGMNLQGKILMGIRDKQIEPFLSGHMNSTTGSSGDLLSEMNVDNEN